MSVVVATTKVGIFKQITTIFPLLCEGDLLLLLPQRQEFSSKSQQLSCSPLSSARCCCYHKGRNFQANHNKLFNEKSKDALLLLPQRQEFSSKSQPQFSDFNSILSCCCYHKGRNFQANHNLRVDPLGLCIVVVATTKVGIFKQITTAEHRGEVVLWLLLLPQRQEFSSKSQPVVSEIHANSVVVATTKVGIFKQITTGVQGGFISPPLLLLPQRQEFSSKSQHLKQLSYCPSGCCCYHKGRNFQANHNSPFCATICLSVVVATTKVGIFKQITTDAGYYCQHFLLLLLPQRQEFSSKSQRIKETNVFNSGCCCYHKGRNFQANHNCRHRNSES